MVVKLSDKEEGSGEKIDSFLCGGIYKEEESSLVTWLGTEPNSNMNCLTCSKEENYHIVPGDQYNKDIKN